MSRGLGCWQRGILAAVEHHGAVYLRDLLPRSTTRAAYQALYRASRRLAAAGQIVLYQGGLSHSPLIVAKHGTPWTVARDCPRLSVESGSTATQINTYRELDADFEVGV